MASGLDFGTDSFHTIVFEHSPDAILVTNADRVIQSVNPAFMALFGYARREAERRSIRILYAHEEDFARLGRHLEDEDSDQSARRYTVLYKRKDASSFTAEVTAKAMLDGDGRYAGHVAIIRDISARVGLKDLFRSIVSLSARASDDDAATVRRFLSLVRDYFGLEAGMVSRAAGETLRVEYLAGAARGAAEGDERPAGRACCRTVLEADRTGSYAHPAAGEQGAPPPCFAEDGVEAWIGAPLIVAGGTYGALSFFGYEPRSAPFSEDDRALMEFLAKWLGGFLEQSEHRTALSRMSDDLARSAENFQRLYREAPAMLHSTDREGRLLEVSDMWLKETGYAREEVLGRPVMKFFTPEWASEVRALLPDFWSGRRRVRNEPRALVRKDGSVIEAEVSGIVSLSDGEANKRSMSVLVDVTERNRALRQLELKNAELERLSGELALTARRFEQLYRATPAMLHSIDPEGRIAEVSDYWLEKMGYGSREEVVGRSISEFHRPEDLERSRRRVADFWREGKPVFDRETSFLRKDGTGFEAELSAIIAGGKDNPDALSLSVVFDVTERNRAWRELEKKNGELERLNEELDTFASVASHDLQEPLRKIGKFAEVLEEDLPEGLGEDGAYALEVMRGAVRRMQTLIADLLDYARTANAAIERQPVDLGGVVERVSDDLSIAIAEADARVTAGPLPTIRGDEQQLRQLFQNLIGNAVKYRDSGKPCEIRIAAEPGEADCAWRVSVRDNGIGFDPGAAETIFHPFRRLQPRSRASGSGLGLTICGRIAERHGWSLQAQSVPGEGSVFTLEIPSDAA